MKRSKAPTVIDPPPGPPRGEPGRLEDPASPTLPGLPDKEYFRIGEAARLVGVKPYVLRYWESEFRRDIRPDRTRSNQRMYRRKDVQTFLEIKRLRYEEKLELPGARRRLRFGAPEAALPELPDLPDELAGELVEPGEGTPAVRADGEGEGEGRYGGLAHLAPDDGADEPGAEWTVEAARLGAHERERLREGLEELLRIVDEDEKAE